MAFNWQSPPKGYLKMNTDASCKGNPGKASYGGIIRDESGGWVKGFHGKLPGLYTPLEAEAWAIIQGLNLVKKFGFRKVLVETDSVGAMQLFSFRHLHQDHPMKDVIEQGLEILVEYECVIVHTRREGNECADKLAELGGRQMRDCNVIHTPPTEVVKLLLKDRFGENWRRVTRLSQHPLWALPLQTIESYANSAPNPIKSLPLHHRPPPVCAPLMPPIGFLHHRRGYLLQPPRLAILH
ncbi:hypothetical protein POM88_000605 [Heracleum sosnowskyi]|uniref:RNase H type-1 domain-containing protein n=1 Tax=Heracleum sosnowskyi TaxID=360622 RepID=A0AAD8JAN3_9APIA|nr:hypothetical protein POM88_000605 [Heracleum sosnowskyi]